MNPTFVYLAMILLCVAIVVATFVLERMDHDIEALKAEVRKLQEGEFYRASRDSMDYAMRESIKAFGPTQGHSSSVELKR